MLEVHAFVGNFEGDGDLATMIVQEVLQFFFRFAAQSFMNGFIAFAWPVFVLDYLGGWAIPLVGALWYAFDRWAKPWIGTKVPELAVVEQPDKDEAGDAKRTKDGESRHDAESEDDRETRRDA